MGGDCGRGCGWLGHPLTPYTLVLSHSSTPTHPHTLPLPHPHTRSTLQGDATGVSPTPVSPQPGTDVLAEETAHPNTGVTQNL